MGLPRVTVEVQECNGHKVVPEDVNARLAIEGEGSMLRKFQVRYVEYNGTGSLDSGAARRRVERDVLDYIKSGRTWFPHYVLSAIYPRTKDTGNH